MVTVPNVRLKSTSQAKAILEKAGFSVVVQYSTSSWLRVNLVAQEVPSGGQRPQGSTITIYVAVDTLAGYYPAMRHIDEGFSRRVDLSRARPFDTLSRC